MIQSLWVTCPPFVDPVQYTAFKPADIWGAGQDHGYSILICKFWYIYCACAEI